MNEKNDNALSKLAVKLDLNYVWSVGKYCLAGGSVVQPPAVAFGQTRRRVSARSFYHHWSFRYSCFEITMVELSPRPLPAVLFLGLVPIGAWFIIRPLLDPVPLIPALYTSLGFSIFAFLSTIYLVPSLGSTFVKANFKGRDLLKTYATPMCVKCSFLSVGSELPQSGKYGAGLRVSVYSRAPPFHPVCVLRFARSSSYP